MSDKKICTQLNFETHQHIQYQLLQLKGVMGLIMTLTQPNSDYANSQINSSAWLVADTIEHIRNTLDESVAEE